MQYTHLQESDPELYAMLTAEQYRQIHGLELIASENYVSWPVLEALGSIFTNKYSEGYPGKRYYGGNEIVDQAETLAIDRAKALFGAEHVNVQPLSGGPANIAVYTALLSPGDSVMTLSLDQGGHLSHGHPLNFSGKTYRIIPYLLDPKTEIIDMDELEKIALREKPKMIVAGFSAYSRNLDWKRFQEIANKIGAITFGDIAHIAGLIAGKQLENPVPIFDVVSTTTHKTLRGPRGGMIMCKEKFAKDINRAVFPGIQGGPHDNVNAAKAVAFGEALRPEFSTYAKAVIENAKALAEALMQKGFRVISGGTDNHLMLIDMASKGLTGKETEVILDAIGITVNKNMIPYDSRKPLDPSGIRLGTAAMTTRGLEVTDMHTVADFIDQALGYRGNQEKLQTLKLSVSEFSRQFPVQGTID